MFFVGDDNDEGIPKAPYQQTVVGKDDAAVSQLNLFFNVPLASDFK